MYKVFQKGCNCFLDKVCGAKVGVDSLKYSDFL